MADIASLQIKVDTSQVKKASNDLNSLSKSSKQAQSSSQGLTSSFIAMRGALAGVGISVTLGQIVRTMDSYTKLTSQLKLATRNQLEFNEAYKNVQRIAETSQSSLEETGVLYARLSNALREMGASQNQVSDVTEAVSLGLKISGASAAEASSAMLQLSQAFSSGVLRGEEFNAVNETAPRLMSALAENIGVARGELRQMAIDGKLTSDVVGNALLKSIEQFRKEAKLTQNISGGLTGISNEFTLMVGEIDKATGASRALASMLASIAKAIRDMRTGQGGWLENVIKATPVGGQIYRAYDALVPDGRPAGREQSGMIRRAGQDGALRAPTRTAESGGSTSRAKGLQYESTAARDLAAAYADLYSSLNQLTDADKSQYDILRDKLNAITNLDKATKDYMNTQIDQLEADEERRLAIAETVEKQKEFNAEVERVKDAADPTRAYTREIELLAKMFDMGRISAAEFSAAAEQAQKNMLQFNETTSDGFEELKNAIEGFSRDAAQSLVDFAFGASTSFEQMANDFAKAIARMIIQKQLLDPLFNGISQSIMGGGSGGLLDSLFGGFASSFFGGGGVQPAAGAGAYSIDANPYLNMSSMPGYANGSEYIPRNMIAKLHQGERVLTKEENKNYSNPKKEQNNGIGNVIMNFMLSGNTDQRSQQQIAAYAFSGISRAAKRNL